MPRDEQTCLLPRHGSSAGGVVWALQCSGLWQAALRRCKPADPCEGPAGVGGIAVCATLSASLPVLCCPGPGSNPCLVWPVIRGVAAAAATGCQWANVLLAFWRGARGDIVVPPPLPLEGAGRPSTGGCFGLMAKWSDAVCALAWLVCVWFPLKRRRNPSLSCTPSLFLPGHHHLLLTPSVFYRLWVARLGQTTSPVVLSLLPLLRALVRALERADRYASTQQSLGTSVQARE